MQALLIFLLSHNAVESLSQHDVIALVVDSRPSPSQKILASMLRIPLVSMYQSYGVDVPKYSVALGTSECDVSQAILDVINEQHWTNLIVMYDSKYI